jgi:hypothetical protein
MPPLSWILAGFGIWLLVVIPFYLNYLKELKRAEAKKRMRLLWFRLRDCVELEKACMRWRECHPFTHISHPEAQTLLRTYIGAYMLFLELEPERDKGTLKKLIVMMEEDSP